jgi:hypothetical protein
MTNQFPSALCPLIGDAPMGRGVGAARLIKLSTTSPPLDESDRNAVRPGNVEPELRKDGAQRRRGQGRLYPRTVETLPNYTYVDATYQSSGLLNSPNNPAAITDPNTGIQFVNVVPDDHIVGIPAHRFKAGTEYAVADKWKVGADLNVVGPATSTN